MREQVAPRQADLFGDQLVSVEQRLGRGWQDLAHACGVRQRGTGPLQEGGILHQARQQRLGLASGRHRVAACQLAAMHRHPGRAETLGAQRRRVRAARRMRVGAWGARHLGWGLRIFVQQGPR
ncbi:hypothetical protein G4G28_23225 [Massilia sp. Dwa41.01b]|uniref:hypothetical protein n=1 Tax=Massilia sp. Dwa41.01b TaxID=2709302 RepID=UPI001604900A|nr:hypothetical protein [Massilia sp. Dwa41.01b]QNA90695.1 hypothetical protein G4G28_23225 [Massilia sp. Dwa41.01b]